MRLYGARLLYVVLVDDGRRRRRHLCDETVLVFRARDLDDAFARALTLGRAAETSYANSAGQRVRWALAEIVAIEDVGHRVDGAEVSSRLHYRTFPESVAATAHLHPERSRLRRAGARRTSTRCR